MLPRALVCGIALLVGVPAAHAGPSKPAALVGVTEAFRVKAPAGFIDDPVAHDDQRLAYVLADGSGKAELHVVTVASRHEEAIDLTPVTSRPIALELIGPRVFVVGTTEDGAQIGALVQLGVEHGKPAGTVIYRVGPATHVTVITRDGKQRVAVHKVSETKQGTRHEVELDAIETGKRVARGHALELGANDTDKKLEFHVNHWGDGMTRAFGIKGGEWNRKTDQRSPDTEAAYDLVTGKFVDRHPIKDLFEQRRRYQTLAEAGGKLDFVRMAWDNSAVELWRGGQLQRLELDQPITNYDPKSLQGLVTTDGGWIALLVDPVNPDAVARKKADPQYLDIFQVGQDGKATRKARILSTGIRHRFGLFGPGRFWLLERSKGFDRGGPALAIYQLH